MIDVAIEIKDAFARLTADRFGAAGVDWLERLPHLLRACAERWNLRVGLPYPSLSYHYVAPAADAAGRHLVIKVLVPEPWHATEVDALRLFAGRGAVALVDEAPDLSALLLERAEPGAPLTVLEDAHATDAAAAVMQRLWRPVPAEHTFPTVEDWSLGLQRHRAAHGGPGPLPAAIFERGDRLFAELLASSGEPMLLHGDIHHGNILSAEREPFLAIDPKGLVGELEYEVGTFLQNPRGVWSTDPNASTILRRRIHQLADGLGADPVRLRDWGCAQSVLSACWSAEDEGYGWESAIASAELLATLRL